MGASLLIVACSSVQSRDHPPTQSPTHQPTQPGRGVAIHFLERAVTAVAGSRSPSDDRCCLSWTRASPGGLPPSPRGQVDLSLFTLACRFAGKKHEGHKRSCSSRKSRLRPGRLGSVDVSCTQFFLFTSFFSLVLLLVFVICFPGNRIRTWGFDWASLGDQIVWHGPCDSHCEACSSERQTGCAEGSSLSVG